MEQQDMTVAEATEAFDAFRVSVSNQADIHVYLSGKGVKCALNPRGLLDKWVIRLGAPTFRELLEDIRRRWEAESHTHASQTVRAMALKIIELTASLGECTDASLRQHFEARDVTRYGDLACIEANDIAGRGPFCIVALRGANEEAA